MTFRVLRNKYSIDQDTRKKVAGRCASITKAVNNEFGDKIADSTWFYIGSYGRHTEMDTSDVDILLELPKRKFERYDGSKRMDSRVYCRHLRRLSEIRIRQMIKRIPHK